MSVHDLCPSYETCKGRCPKHVFQTRIAFNNLIMANGYPHPGPALAFNDKP